MTKRGANDPSTRRYTGSTDKVKRSMAFPKALHERLDKRADQQGVSFNSLVIGILQSHLHRERMERYDGKG